MDITTKKCFKCGIEWPLIYFYKHPQMKDGHLNKCKKCARRYVNKNTVDKAEYYKEYDRKRAKEPERLAFNAANTKRWRKENPIAAKAHSAVNNAIRAKKLIKKPCCVCGEIKVHAHHEDYSKPLDVVWVCAYHHRQIDLR